MAPAKASGVPTATARDRGGGSGDCRFSVPKRGRSGGYHNFPGSGLLRGRVCCSGINMLREGDGGGGGGDAGDGGRAGNRIADEGGVRVQSYGSNDAHKPAHAHVTGEGRQVRIGPNGKPLKGQAELSTKQAAVVKNNKTAIRKELKKVGKANQRLERQ